MKKFLSMLLIMTMVLSLAAVAHAELPAYKDLVVGESYTDITANLKVLNHRTQPTCTCRIRPNSSPFPPPCIPLPGLSETGTMSSARA